VCALVSAMLSTAHAPAAGATCVQLTPHEARERANVVAVGRVEAVRSADLRAGGEIDFKVLQALKGTDAGRTLTVAIAVDGAASVGYWVVEPGTWHTLYLRSRADWPGWPDNAPSSTLYTSGCFGSHEGPPREEERTLFGIGPFRLPDRHPSGIAIAPPIEPGSIKPLDDALARAWSDSVDLANQNAELLGPPWVDRTAGQLVISLFEGFGSDVVRSWIEVGAPRGDGSKPAPPLEPPRVPVRVRDVPRSMAELRRIQDELTHPEPAGYKGDPRIWAVWIDEQYDRVVFQTDRANDELLQAIAIEYGTEAVAVQVDPTSGMFRPGEGSRSDSPVPAWIVVAGYVAMIAVGLLLERRRRNGLGEVR